MPRGDRPALALWHIHHGEHSGEDVVQPLRKVVGEGLHGAGKQVVPRNVSQTTVSVVGGCGVCILASEVCIVESHI